MLTMAIIFAFVVLLLLGYGFLTGASIATSAAMQTTDNVVINNAPKISHPIDASNQATWPTGDRIWNCCRAIAIAEGYDIPNSNPARLNNPGDISDGASIYGSEFHSGSNITKFPDAVTGWQWLYVKLQRAYAGQSDVYNSEQSWNEIGKIWAPPNASTWASNVANELGVDADSSLGDYIDENV